MPSNYPIEHEGRLFSPSGTATATIPTLPVCVDCGDSIAKPKGITTGYATDRTGAIVCFACCGKRDAATLGNAKAGENSGHLGVPLYLSFTDEVEHRGVPQSVSNWPGSLSFQVPYYAKGCHNWGLTRWDVWFVHAGAWWWGVKYGGWDIVHCRKLKTRPRWMLP